MATKTPFQICGAINLNRTCASRAEAISGNRPAWWESAQKENAGSNLHSTLICFDSQFKMIQVLPSIVKLSKTASYCMLVQWFLSCVESILPEECFCKDWTLVHLGDCQRVSGPCHFFIWCTAHRLVMWSSIQAYSSPSCSTCWFLFPAGFCRFAFLYPWLYLNSWRVENTVVGPDLCFLYCVIHPSFMNLLTETDELLSLLHITMQVTGYKPSCWAVGMSLGFLVLPPGMSWKGQPYLAQTWYL